MNNLLILDLGPETRLVGLRLCAGNSCEQAAHCVFPGTGNEPSLLPPSLARAGLFSGAALLSVPGGFLGTPSSSSERSPASGSPTSPGGRESMGQTARTLSGTTPGRAGGGTVLFSFVLLFLR